MLTACSQSAADFTLTLGGDIMLAREGEPIFEHQNMAINPWLELQKQGVLIEGDYFFANLESPLGEISSELTDMNLCSDPSQVKVLIEGGVDLVSLANNHRDDCVSNGAAITKLHLDEQNIQYAVMEADPVLLEFPGGVLGVIAAEDVTGLLDVDTLLAEIETVREQSQLVVVSMHWGNEYQAGIDARQQKLAQQIADAGADVIWGHHPHVLQKMAWLESADGRQVLVLFSLGNLLADQWMLGDAQQSALVRLSFKDNDIEKIEIIPIVLDRHDKLLRLITDTAQATKIFDRLEMETQLIIKNN